MTKTSQRPDIVQWLDKSTDRYLKVERATGEVISQKVSPGAYKNIHIAKRRPRQRTLKPSANQGTITSEQAQAAVKAVKKKVAKPTKERKPRKVNYLNNKDLLIEVAKSKENIQANGQPMMTDKLAHMLQVLAARYGKKGNFAGYSYNDDMQAFAMMMLVRTWKSFDPDKSNNPFAFFTQCIKNSFIQFLNSERRQRDVRDLLLVDQGLDASYTYQEKYNAEMIEQRSSMSDDVVRDVADSTDGSDGIVD
jgi:hypothetical protein